MNGLKGMSARAPTSKMQSIVSAGAPKIHPAAAAPRTANFPKVPTTTHTKSFGGPGGILRVPRAKEEQ